MGRRDLGTLAFLEDEEHTCYMLPWWGSQRRGASQIVREWESFLLVSTIQKQTAAAWYLTHLVVGVYWILPE